MKVNKMYVRDKKTGKLVETNVIHGKSAYEQYKIGGGTLTEEEFIVKLNHMADMSDIEEAKEELNESVSELSKEIDKLSNNIIVWNYHLNEAVTSDGIQRYYVPMEVKQGEVYYFKCDINNLEYPSSGSIVFNFRTRKDGTIIDSISGEYSKEEYKVGKRNFVWEFTPTQNTDELYIYLNSKSGNVDINIVLYSGNIFNVLSLKENVGSQYYVGQKIALDTNPYQLDLFKKLEDSISDTKQGMCIYDNKVFSLHHGGKVSVYDIDGANTPIATFKLGSYDANNNHCNNANFSNKFMTGDVYPLMYVTDGNSAEIMRCAVERIANDLSGSTKVQTIELDQSEFETKGYIPYWGWSAWLVSDDYLYYFGAKYRTNGSEEARKHENCYIVTKFNIPTVNGNPSVVLTANDIVEQWTDFYDTNVTQGGCIYKDYIFYGFGYGNSSAPTIIKVFSLSQKKAVATIDLSSTIVHAFELEDISVSDNKLYLQFNHTDMYTIKFS